MDYKEKYFYFCENVPSTDPMYQELLEIAESDDLIKERFLPDLSFGTAGLRGKLHLGTNCMNYYTVKRAAQGIADYILTYGEEAKKRGIVIAHDPRHYSAEFCRLSASIFATNGIKVYVFDDMRPTPQLAYLIRVLNTISGINITASHNPKDYNGYKAYWEDGCQVSADIADSMYECIKKLDYFTDIKEGDYDSLVASGLITVLGPEYDRMYLDEIKSLRIHTGAELDLDIPIVYTPLNGAGMIFFEKMMQECGFTHVSIVEQQNKKDPDFTTVGYPNPESVAAFKMAEELGKATGAQLLLATDPDADRFAIEIMDSNGEYLPLNGNQTGYLLVNYILEGKKEAGTLPDNGAMVKSIVTSTLSTNIASAYGVKMYESLTGFKNICGRIPYLQENNMTYLFGYEESVGYACSPNIRDKDGISAALLVSEAAAFYKKQGKSLIQVLDEIYEKYGYFSEDEPNIILEGLEGAARIKRMMEAIRDNPPSEIAGNEVESLIDYKNGYEDIPPSNVLRFFLKGGSWFAIRPSGTEPKIKFYFYAVGTSKENAKALNISIKNDILTRINLVE